MVWLLHLVLHASKLHDCGYMTCRSRPKDTVLCSCRSIYLDLDTSTTGALPNIIYVVKPRLGRLGPMCISRHIVDGDVQQAIFGEYCIVFLYIHIQYWWHGIIGWKWDWKRDLKIYLLGPTAVKNDRNQMEIWRDVHVRLTCTCYKMVTR